MMGASPRGRTVKTEADWLAATDWRKLRSRAGAQDGKSRKFRLFAVACCRRVAHLFGDPRADAGLLANERFADGLATEAQLAAAAEEVLTATREEVMRNGASRVAWARDAVWRMSNPERVSSGIESCLKAVKDGPAERAAQTVLFRDIFGNPFRAVAVNPAWLTTDVLALARGTYEDKAFEHLPILADALQDAGCDSDLLLAHCRDEHRVHARGCWAVDLLLGKS